MNEKTIKLFLKILSSVAPPKKISVSEWADENRVLTSENAAEPGRWNSERVPFQKEIMNAVNDPKCEKVVVMSSAQIGKSEIINNIIGYYADIDPCPMILIQPTIHTAEEYSKQRIAPLIENTQILKTKIADTKSRNSDNTILMKTFHGGFLTIAGANSPSGLASKPIRIVFCDEVDRFPDSAGTEGDPIKLVEKRTITFANRKLIYTSTPTIKGISRIEFEYEKGTREEWQHECPHCGQYFQIKLQDIRFEYETEEYNSQKIYYIKEVKWRCPCCLEEFSEYKIKKQPAMWIPNNSNFEKTRSFKLNAFYSPFISWKSIIQEFLDSKSDPEKLKTFYNTMLGESFEERGEIESEDFLLLRQEEYSAELPDGVLLLTCGVDTQDDRLEYEIVGWGQGEESWGIEKGLIMGKPDDEKTWIQLLDVLDKKRCFSNGKYLTVTTTCVDSGGHYTEHVYKYCKKLESRQVFPIKGRGGSGVPFTSIPKRTTKYNAALFILGVDAGKAQIMSRLKINEIGQKYCHFPKESGYDGDYFKGLLSEKLVHKKKNGTITSVWEKVNSNIRNEALDCRNYAFAALKILNPNFDRLESIIKNSELKPKKTTRQKTNYTKRSNIW